MRNFLRSILRFSLAMLLFFPSISYAFDMGDWPMDGNIVIPITEHNVRIKEIKIEIKKIGGEATAIFLLENLSESNLSFEVAYPIESNCNGCTGIQRNFKVYVDNKVVKHTVMKNLRSALSSDEYEAGYVWTISMKPKELKSVKCSFRLGGSVDPGIEDVNYKFNNLSFWKDKVDKATIRIGMENELITNLKRGNVNVGPDISIEPQQYNIVGNNIEWNFLNENHINDIYVSIDWRGPVVKPSVETKFNGEIVYEEAGRIFKMKGTPFNKVFLANGVQPKWSPNGETIAYMLSNNRRNCELYTMDANGANQKRIIGVECDTKLSWNPDSTIVKLRHNYKNLYYLVNVQTGSYEINDLSRSSMSGCTQVLSSDDKTALFCQKGWGITVYSRTDVAMAGQKKHKVNLDNNYDPVVYESKQYRKLKKELKNADIDDFIWSEERDKFATLLSGSVTILDWNLEDLNKFNIDCGHAREELASWDDKRNQFLIWCGFRGVEGTPRNRLYILDLEQGSFEPLITAEIYSGDWFTGFISGQRLVKQLLIRKTTYDAGTRLLTEDDLQHNKIKKGSKYDKLYVRALRNEIFARHGRTFQSEDLKSIFQDTEWYKTNPNYSDDMLNDIEKKNVQFILDYEKKKGWR